MKTPDLKTIESALEARATELTRSLAERHQITIERAADAIDATLLAAGRESSARMLAHEFELLRQIEAARDRLRDGSFGMCVGCEEGIASKRLEVIPWAAYCVSCQAEVEQGQTFRPSLARAA